MCAIDSFCKEELFVLNIYEVLDKYPMFLMKKISLLETIEWMKHWEHGKLENVN